MSSTTNEATGAPAARATRRCPEDKLTRRCDPASLGFATTSELDEVRRVIGQARAIEAVQFGAGIAGDSFHLFASGPTGIGRRALLATLLQREATSRTTPPAWCYVHNFEASHRPIAIQLPPGVARALHADMERLVEELKAALPAALESQEFQRRVVDIQEELSDKQEQAFAALSAEVEKESIRLVRTPGGFAFAPVRDGEVVTPEKFAEMPHEEQEKIQKTIEEAQSKLAGIVRSTIEWAKEARDRVKEEGRTRIRAVVDGLIATLRERYAGYPRVVAHLAAVAADIVEHPEDFGRERAEATAAASFEPPGAVMRASLARYSVNVLIDPGPDAGAPVIFEEHPTLANLIGHADWQSRFGALTTDFTLLKPGALHKANGGFLVLDVRKVLMQPLAWEALERALHSREIRIESPAQMLALISTVAPEPEPIPLDVKVILIGDRYLYYLLHQLDPDFRKLFKVQADFDDEVGRDGDSERLCAQVLATLTREQKLRPFDAAAVARVIDRLGRLTGDSMKLSAHIGDLRDLVREAEFHADRREAAIVQAEDVEAALAAQRRRCGRIRELILEQIGRGTIMVTTEGSVVGQVNGLSVLGYGDTLLGQPARITATARVGNGEVIDIEREVRLGGPTHSKGVMILSHVLAQRFAREKPLALSASLVFEQSYGKVDGDSASLGELCALLSALSDVPIEQSIAITGSVDQNGWAQAIGGVNEKIEGFFDVCVQKGLTGSQGVIIPATNVEHLMLRDDVVAATAESRFHIWTVGSVDDAIEILTGVAAGVRGADGTWTAGSIGARVQARLDQFLATRRELARAAGDGDGRSHIEPTTAPADPSPPLPGPPNTRGGQ